MTARSAEGYVDAPDESSLAFPPEDAEQGPGRRAGGSAVGRSASVVLGLVLVLAAAGGLGWALYRYAQTTPRFAIDTVEVRGTRRLGTETVMEVAGIARGQNIFTLDAAKAEQALVEVPWVKQARIERRLPSTLLVELVEREAVAVAAVEGRLYLVSRAAEPFKELEEGDPYDLPVITGIDAKQWARDREGATARLVSALELLRRYASLPMARRYVAQELHLSPAGEAVLTVGSAGTALYLGEPPWQKKLLRAIRVLERMGSRAEPAAVFADNRAHPERVVVRMR